MTAQESWIDGAGSDGLSVFAVASAHKAFSDVLDGVVQAHPLCAGYMEWEAGAGRSEPGRSTVLLFVRGRVRWKVLEQTFRSAGVPAGNVHVVPQPAFDDRQMFLYRNLETLVQLVDREENARSFTPKAA